MKKRIKETSKSLSKTESPEIKIKSYQSPAEKKLYENTRHAFVSEKEND
jgi:hypothetical protein